MTFATNYDKMSIEQIKQEIIAKVLTLSEEDCAIILRGLAEKGVVNDYRR